MWNIYGNKVGRNSIKEIYDFLRENPFSCERDINYGAFGYIRSGRDNNKKYADMLRRGVTKGTIKRIYWPWKKNEPSKYFYYLAD